MSEEDKKSDKSDNSDKSDKSDKKEDKEEKKEEKKEKKDRKGTEEELENVSYTYWKRESDLQADHKGFQPEKVTNPPPQTNPSVSQQNNIGSAWNKAGTWEEKKITKNQVESFFNEYIKKNKKEYKGAFFFDEFTNYSGDVTYIYIILFYI